jgi:membrane associated rhomboid family serine protease
MTSIIHRPFKYRYDNVTLILISVNLLVFLLQKIIPSLTAYLSLNPIAIVFHGMFWQFFTYMFAHGSIMHVVFNMLGLFFFGTPVERQMGSKEFFLFYMVTGFLAGIFSFGIFWITGSYMVFLLGASGAIFGVQLAYAVFFPHSVVYVWGILPVKAPVLVLGFTAVELFSSVFGVQSGVAHLTHLAGFAVAWLYFVIRFGMNPWKQLTS